MKRSSCMLFLLIATAAGPAWSQASPEARMREQLKQTILDLRQVQDENAELKSKLAAPQAAAPKDDGAERRARAEAKKQSGLVAELRAQLDTLQKQLEQSQAAATAAATAQRSSQEQQALSERSRIAVQQQYAACQVHNGRLVGISNELIQRYRDRGVTDVILGHEALTGLRRAELERLSQEYKSQVLEQQMSQAPAETAPN